MTQPVEGAQSGAGTEGQSATGTTDGNATGAATQGQSAQTADANATVSRAEYDQRMAQLAAADRKREEAEQKLKALQDAALSEEEKRKRDLAEATEQLRVKDETIRGLQIDLAFLKDNTHDWHNPQAALALADKSKLQISDDGKTVNGLKEALTAVATAHPYLLKPKAEGTTETGQGAGSTGVTGVSGQGSSSGQGNAGRAGLDKRFPALRGRVS